MTSQPTSAALRCLQRRSEAENAVTTAAMQWLSNLLTQSDLYEVVKQVTTHFPLHSLSQHSLFLGSS